MPRIGANEIFFLRKQIDWLIASVPCYLVILRNPWPAKILTNFYTSPFPVGILHLLIGPKFLLSTRAYQFGPMNISHA